MERASGEVPAVHLRCPLCDGTRAAPIWAVTAEAVRSRLTSDWDTNFDGDAFPLTPKSTLALHECRSCALQFFVPAIPGSPDFYRKLMQGLPYEPDRWEFGQVAREVSSADRVVDYGCGMGAFLRIVKPHVLRAVGVDHNLDAIECLRRTGLEGEALSVREFAERNPEYFDIACAFQTLEHVADISQFMEAIVHSVRPGGRVFLSVPNRRRFGREDGEPLDCPPHHLSRWDPVQWQTLASRFGLNLVDVRFEEPDFSHARLFHRQRLEQRFDRMLGQSVPSVVAGAYLHLAIGSRRHSKKARHGAYSRRGVYGHTMLAQFCRPPSR